MIYFELTPSGNVMGAFRTITKGHYGIFEDQEQMPLNYLLTSKHFKKNLELSEIVCVGKFILFLIKGYSILIDANHTGFYPHLNRLYVDGKREEIVRVDLDLNSIDDLLIPDVCDYDDSSIINAAFKPGFFRDILIYAGSGWNLANISRINDELITFVKLNGGEDKEFRSKKDFGRFQAVSNSKAIGGYNARHGSKYSGGDAYSEKPMTLEEASKYIKDYLNAVLNKYYGFELPVLWKKEEVSLTEIFKK